MIQVGISGAVGRMGKTLVQLINENEGLALAAGIEAAGNQALGQDIGELSGIGPRSIALTDDLDVLARVDVVIDFTVPDATLALAQRCAELGKAMVIGTTGLTPEQLDHLNSFAQRTPIFVSPNMSVGVNLSMHLIRLAAEALGDTVDVEVIEAHHRHKIDAPSGTALRIGEVLAEALHRDLATDAIYGREGITGARERNTIGFSTVRGGDIVGEHTVLFAGEGERLEITHRAHSRTNFAQGALRAAEFIVAQPAGWYDMSDLLGF